MTTIAFDGDTLAVESGITLEDGSTDLVCQSKFYALPGRYVAIAGNMTFVDDIVKWIKEGAHPEDTPNGSWTVVVFNVKRKKAYEYVSNSYKRSLPLECKVPYAAGTGGKVALGAMAAGADAIDAVKIACKYDAYSVLPVFSNSVINGEINTSKEPFDPENRV